MKIVTYNAGLLNLKMAGISLKKVPAFIEERCKVLPTVLRESGADIICLQEVFEYRHREFLKKELSDLYPYVEWARS